MVHGIRSSSSRIVRSYSFLLIAASQSQTTPSFGWAFRIRPFQVVGIPYYWYKNKNIIPFPRSSSLSSLLVKTTNSSSTMKQRHSFTTSTPTATTTTSTTHPSKSTPTTTNTTTRSNPHGMEEDQQHQQQQQQQQCAIYYGGWNQPVYEKRISMIPIHHHHNHNHTKPNHLVIQVHAVGINPVDAKQVIGDKLPYHWKTLRQWAHRFLVQDTRVGFDFSGIVRHVGSSSSSSSSSNSQTDGPSSLYQPGDKVYGTMPPLVGSCAEYIQVPIHQVAKMPTTFSMEQAAALPLVGLTAWQALSPHIRPHLSAVLILGGSGGTGHIAIQMAKALQAKYVVAVCGTSNVAFCKHTCGATHVINYQSEHDGDVITQLQTLVSTVLGRPFDVILDCVTSADPNDRQMNYPVRIRSSSSSNTPIVTTDHLYQRLGGPCPDWIRAAMVRFLRQVLHLPTKYTNWIWPDPREQLFWITFPYSSHQLRNITHLAEQFRTHDGMKEDLQLQQQQQQQQQPKEEKDPHQPSPIPLILPHISKVYSGLTASNVQSALDDLLRRRVQGKIVIQVIPPLSLEQS